MSKNPVSVKEVLSDYSHPLHEPVMDALVELNLGNVKLCACLGAQFGEPYCPCKMEQMGLPPSEARLKAMENSKESIARFCKSDIFKTLKARAEKGNN